MADSPAEVAPQAAPSTTGAPPPAEKPSAAPLEPSKDGPKVEGKEGEPAEIPQVERRAKMSAAIARKERLLRERDTQLKAEHQKRELEWTARQQERDSDAKDARAYRELAELQKKDPYEFIQKIGLDLTELNKRFLSGGQKSADQLVEEKLAAFEARQKEDTAKAAKDAEAKRLESQQADVQRGLDVEKSKMARLATSNAERWELLAANPDAIETAWQATLDSYKAGNQVTYEQVLDAAEQDLQTQLVKLYANSKKLSGVKTPAEGPKHADPVVENAVKARLGARRVVPQNVAAVPEKKHLTAAQRRAEVLKKYTLQH